MRLQAYGDARSAQRRKAKIAKQEAQKWGNDVLPKTGLSRRHKTLRLMFMRHLSRSHTPCMCAITHRGVRHCCSRAHGGGGGSDEAGQLCSSTSLTTATQEPTCSLLVPVWSPYHSTSFAFTRHLCYNRWNLQILCTRNPLLAVPGGAAGSCMQADVDQLHITIGPGCQ